jgi:ATP-dependent protease HslVU (ClpYQ) ATPase subunit
MKKQREHEIKEEEMRRLLNEGELEKDEGEDNAEDAYVPDLEMLKGSSMKEIEQLESNFISETDKQALQHRWRMRDLFKQMQDEGKFDNLPRVRGIRKMKAFFWSLLHFFHLAKITH